MDVSRHPWLTILWAGVILAPLGAQSPTPSPVVTAYFSERPPFAIVDGQTGILITLTKVILSEAGIRARFIELPAPRIIELLKSGQTDALGVGWYKTSGKSPAGRFSAPIYQEHPVVALMNARVATAAGSLPKLDSLLTPGYTLALKSGTSLGPLLDVKIRASGVVALETVVAIPTMLKFIQNGRMDYTLLSEEEASYLVKTDPTLTPGLSLVRLADAPAGNYRYFLYPEGFDPLLADRIDAAIEKLKDSARSPASSRPLQEPPSTILVEPPALPDSPGDKLRNPAKTPTAPKPTKDGKPPLIPVPPTPTKP